MARRPRARVDTSRLRAMGETSAVVARPVDTYVRPAAPQKNQQYAQILSALSTVNPALDNFITDKVTKDREKQANLGEKSFYEATPEERKAMSAKIKSGEINELQSPFWVEGFARSLLRNHATTFGSALTLEWNRQKDSGGFDFNAFVAEERGKYIEANNLSSFRSDLFNDEFAAVTRTFENQVLQRNYEHRISQAKKARMQSLGDSMFTVIQGMQEALDTEKFDGQKGDTFSAQINAEIQTAIDQGLDPSGVIGMAEGFLKGTILDLAQNEENQDIAKGMLRNLKLKSGTYGVVYKDKYEAIERSADSIMLRAEADAEQADNDALTTEKERLFEEIYDGLNKAIDDTTNPTAVQDFWEASTTDLRRIGKLDEFTDGDMLPTLNKLYKTRGKITPDVTDEEMLDLLEGVDSKGTYTPTELQTLAEDMGLSTNQFIAFQNYNRDRPNQFLKELGINGVRKALTDGVDAKGMFDFGPQGGISLEAIEARGKLNAYIKGQLSLDATKETKIANILAESQRLIEEYGSKAKNTNVQTQAQNSIDTPTASVDTVENFKNGTHSPWKKPDGSMVLSDTASAVEAFEKAVRKGESLDSTEFGALIGPLLKAGVPLDTILNATLADFEASLGLQDSKAAEEIKGFFPELTTDVTQPTPKSVQPLGSTDEVVEALTGVASDVGEFVSGYFPSIDNPLYSSGAEEKDNTEETAENPTPQDFLDFLKKTGSKIPKNPDEFFEMGPDEYRLFEEIYGVEALKGDDGSFSDDKVQAIFDELNKIDRAASITGVDDKGRGTFIPSLEEAERFAGTNVPSEPPLSETELLQREARSMTPMDINQDPDFANIVSKADQNKLTYTATPGEIEAMNDVLGKTDLDNMNEVAARVQAVYPDINEQQLRDIIKRVSDYRAADGSTARPVGVDMASPSMVAPASSMQSPSMSSPASDGAVNTGVAPKSESSMMPASFKTQLPEAGSAGQAVTLDEEDAKILRGILRDQRIAEFKAKRAENAAAVKMERTARQDAMRMQRKNVSKKEAAKAEEERQNKLRTEREERQQEYLRKQTIRRSKTIAKIIAERAKKYPEKYGATMSDDLASYLNKTKPLWSNYWDTVLADGEEIPAVFYEVLKENMRKRISN